jgi:two-component system, probable response regulator PhcQ
MESLYDYRKFAILYVDDEETLLKHFSRVFGETFRVLTASNTEAGYSLLEQHRDEIAVLMTDQRMPGEKGVQFLERARQLHPKAVRILTTAYSDLDVAIASVNSGAIYKYATKPWDVSEMETTLKRASEFFIVQRERDFLLREKLAALHRMMITDRMLSLGILAAGLGHYVRNSLVAVRTFLDLVPDNLMEEKWDPEQIRNPNYWKEFYDQAQGQIRRITELLTDIVDVTQATHLPFVRPVEVHLNEIVKRSVGKVSGDLAEKQITVSNQIPAGLPALTVEGESFQRLFDLLLQYEAMSLPDKSHISLNAREAYGQEPALEIEIRDDGPGLRREALRSVFDPFFLRLDQHPELGINLMACYFIVYHHGGRIDVQNKEGRGILLTVTFPVRSKRVPPADDEEAFISKVLQNDALWERLITGT